MADSIKFTSASSFRKPAVVLIPGAFHRSSVFKWLGDELQKLGYECYGVEFRSLIIPENSSRPLAASHLQDANVIRNLLEDLIGKQQKEVILFAWSYGGYPATEAAAGFQRSKYAAKGQPGGIVHLIYCAAYAPIAGQTVAGTGKLVPEGSALPNDYFHISDDSTHAIPDKTPVKEFIYADASDEVAETIVNHSIAPMAIAVCLTPLVGEGWRDVSCTYIHTGKDKAFLPVLQHVMVEQIRSHGAQIDVVELSESSHAPFAAQPRRVAEIIDACAKKME